MFSADEHFAGLDPSQGIELCAVVESMFSYEDAFSILGDPMLAERLERVAFNALPGTISDDMWSHQYDQQPNQIECTRAPRDWTTNGNDSNLFGLAPNFGCCTANLHQGWPKFTESLWMATPLKDGAGLVTVAYAPSRVRTQLHGTWVGIDEATEYPFRNSVQFTVHPAHPVKFPLVLRIPDWSPQMQLSIDGASTQTIANPCDPASHSTCNTSDLFYRIDRTWHAGDTVRVTFAMPPRVTHWYNRSVALERGPLVFSLPLGENWSSLKHYAQKSNDWQITSSTPWNYALAVPQCGITVRQLPLGPIPFSAQNAAVQLQVWGRRLPQWKMVDNSAAPPPVSPVQSAAPLQRLTFIPYAAAKLRVTALPSLDENLSCEKIPANSSANIRPAKSRIAKNRSAGQ